MKMRHELHSRPCESQADGVPSIGDAKARPRVTRCSHSSATSMCWEEPGWSAADVEAKREPGRLLWIADAVAGAVRSYLVGAPDEWYERFRSITAVDIEYARGLDGGVNARKSRLPS